MNLIISTETYQGFALKQLQNIGYQTIEAITTVQKNF